MSYFDRSKGHLVDQFNLFRLLFDSALCLSEIYPDTLITIIFLF
jgi:hypothetical protein